MFVMLVGLLTCSLYWFFEFNSYNFFLTTNFRALLTNYLPIDKAKTLIIHYPHHDVKSGFNIHYLGHGLNVT